MLVCTRQKEVVYNSSWEILASAEAIVCQAELYC